MRQVLASPRWRSSCGPRTISSPPAPGLNDSMLLNAIIYCVGLHHHDGFVSRAWQSQRQAHVDRWPSRNRWWSRWMRHKASFDVTRAAPTRGSQLLCGSKEQKLGVAKNVLLPWRQPSGCELGRGSWGRRVQPLRPLSNGEPELCGCDDEEDEDMFGEEDDHHDDAARSLKFHQRLPRDVLRHAQCHGKEALQRNTVGRGKQELVSGMRAGCSLYFSLILFSRMKPQRQNQT